MEQAPMPGAQICMYTIAIHTPYKYLTSSCPAQCVTEQYWHLWNSQSTTKENPFEWIGTIPTKGTLSNYF